MYKFELKSGKKIEFNLASIEKGLELYRTFILECQKAGINLELGENEQIGALFTKNYHLILAVLGSKAITDCIISCCDKVLYNGQRFNMDLFEEENARQDFFPLITIVGVENIRPFFPNLDTAYSLILSLVLKD